MPKWRIEIDRRPIERVVVEVECSREELTHGFLFDDDEQRNKQIEVWDSVFADLGGYELAGIQSQFITNIEEI